ILRALQQAVRNQRKTGTTVTGIQPGATQPGRTSSTQTTTAKKKPKGPIGKALRDITPGGADSFPLPLLILGLLAILLVLAGVGGMIWRRYQGPGTPP